MAYFVLIAAWLAYGALHSVLASRAFKRYIYSRFPKLTPYYRLLYNLVAVLLLIVLLYYQAGFSPLRLWPASIPLTVVGISMAGIGLGVGVLALRQYDLSEFLGLDGIQARNKAQHLQTHGLSGWVRHPLYLGFLLMLWGMWLFEPTLTNLLMNLCLSVYIRVGIYFEEKKLLQDFGQKYYDYQQRVPMLFPSFF
jgi:methanethiol S-methyltransferase